MSKSYITVTLGEYLFGIDVSLIREVNRSVDMTPVALAPEMIRGLMNLRGQIITVIDPGVCLGFQVSKIENTSRCVVLKTIEEGSSLSIHDILGILVDNVGDIIPVEDTDLQPPPPNLSELNSQYIQYVVKLDQDLLIILDMAKVLDPVCQRVAV